MSNVITLSGPNPTQQIVSQFLDQYNANHRADQANALGRDELAQRTQAQTDTNAYQQGTLKDAQDKFALIKQQYADEEKQKQAKQYVDRMSNYHDAIQALQPSDPQRAALEAQARTEMASAPPELLPYIKIATLEPILTPARQEQLSTQQTMTGAAGGMAGGKPTPLQADTFSKRNFKMAESPEMVKDIQSRQPEAIAPPAEQTPSPTTDYYRGPALGLDTTSAQDQVAQTAITDTKLQGNAQRDVANIHAKSALDVAKVPNELFGSLTGGGAAGAAPQGDQMNSLVKSIVERKFDPMLMRRWKPEQQAAVEAAVRQTDPQFSMADYQSQVAAKKAFAAGPQSQNITAINTAIRHLATLSVAMNGLKNSNIPLYNTAANFIGQQTGDAKIQQSMSSVNKAADAVANELNKAFRGSGTMSEKDTASWRQGLGTSTTPAEMQGAIKTAAQLLAGRNEELQIAYERGVGRPVDMQFINKGTQAILQKLGIADLFAGGASGAPSGGDVITTPDGLKWTKNPDGSMTQVP